MVGGRHDMLAFAFAFALAALGCGRISALNAGDAGGDGAPDVATTCPIASCLAALRAVQAACPIDGIACTTTVVGDQINDCFANGVQIHIDGETNRQTTSVLAAGGRLCYSVLDEPQLVGTTFTVMSSSGQIILREYYRSDTETTIACPDGTTLTDGPAHPCGAVRTLPEDRGCITGVCLPS